MDLSGPGIDVKLKKKKERKEDVGLVQWGVGTQFGGLEPLVRVLFSEISTRIRSVFRN